jgi:predicted nucleic-acid-binding Zn-ribbon protein
MEGYGLDRPIEPFSIRSNCPKCKQDRWDRKFIKQTGSPYGEWLLNTCLTCGWVFRMYAADHEGANE